MEEKKKTSDDLEKLLTKKAQEWAEKFIGNNPKSPKLKSSQLRKFYNEVRSLAAKAEGGNFEKVKPLIKMLEAKVNYQKGRKVVPEEFVDFISEWVKKVDSEEDFKRFVKHFEAVVGFYYGKAERFE